MNTQSKIVPASQVRTPANIAIVGGWFDPVTADVARWVESVAHNHEGSKLLAVVFDGPDSLLPAESRAILVAALRAVDLVTVLPHQEWPNFFDGQKKYDVPHSTDFIELVLRKSAVNSEA